MPARGRIWLPLAFPMAELELAPAPPWHSPGGTYPLEEVLGSVLLMPVLEGFRS